jgi:hypothetical protein
MNDQVNEKIETEFVQNENGQIKPQTNEDKFFGVKTEIQKPNPEEDLKVEVIDDTPEEDRRPTSTRYTRSTCR